MNLGGFFVSKSVTDERAQNISAVLVTGGAGYLGSQLVKRLADKGEVVVSMYNRKLPEPYNNVFPVCSDLQSAELLAVPLRGVSTVVHLAWQRNFLGPSSSENHGEKAGPLDNLSSLKNLIHAMEKAKTRRIIFVSALGVSRTSELPFLREKYACESAIINSAIPEKVILRSSVVFGSESQDSLFVEAISRVMKYPGFYPLPRFKQNLSLIHMHDLITLIHNLIKKTEVEHCSLLEVISRKQHKLEDIFSLVSTHKAKGARLPLSSFLGNFLLPFFERGGAGDKNIPKIKHFLALDKASHSKEPIVCNLSSEVPKKLKTFNEDFAKSR
tara:strand:+ start:36 stop:1019 length:984 start_codon:yes stop_codon:yes gene_type:complete